MRVVNKKTHRPTAADVFIGRPSVLGNRFSHLPNSRADVHVATREEAVERYRQWLWQELKAGNQEIIQAIKSIPDDANLVCFCSPLACHGDVLERAVPWVKAHL